MRTLIVINRMTKRLGLPTDKSLGLKPSTLKPTRLDAAGVKFMR